MLTVEEIDRLENFLYGVTLQDVPKVFGKVLPFLFAELRTMQIALDQQSKEFFDEARFGTGAGVADSKARQRGSDGTGRGDDPAQLPIARSQSAVRPDQATVLATADDHQPRGDRPASASGAGALGQSGLGAPVGGEVRDHAGDGPATSSQQDVVVKRKRGRPRKILPIEGRS